MKVIYLAWQDRRTRRWFPVGQLIHNESKPPQYEFTYTQGAEKAKESANFIEILEFPELSKRYGSDDLFSKFRSRAMNLHRPDRDEYLSQLAIDPNDWDPVIELSVSGGHSQHDNFEIFPAIEPDSSGRFQTEFILHGLRFTNSDSIKRTDSIEAGDELQLSFELNNPQTTHAITVKTNDQYILGWLPRYLVDCMHQDGSWIVEEVEVTVTQVNRSAPLSHRLLLKFSGRLPSGKNPMRDLEQYQPIPEG